MILSFRNDHLQQLWEAGKPLPHKTTTAIETLRLLDVINAAIDPGDIAFYGIRFDPWGDNGSTQYGMLLTEHWLISFGWDGEDAVAVDLERID
ncbi:MAG: type II toxin-antitoxin system RelE/ParE family toxin [Hyphomicrobiaceae bacterium]|nr:type II toxin-antitoxin system RelE/ParE family toxin [Hyphomicrobiaceae bacterium]